MSAIATKTGKAIARQNGRRLRSLNFAHETKQLWQCVNRLTKDNQHYNQNNRLLWRAEALGCPGPTRFLDAKSQQFSRRKATFSEKFEKFSPKIFDSSPKISDNFLKPFTKNFTNSPENFFSSRKLIQFLSKNFR